MVSDSEISRPDPETRSRLGLSGPYDSRDKTTQRMASWEGVVSGSKKRKLALLLHLAQKEEQAERIATYAKRVAMRRTALLNPDAEETAWTRLFRSKCNDSFLASMGFGVEVFNDLASKLKAPYAVYSPYTLRPCETKTPRKRLLDYNGCLGLVLHYLHSECGHTQLCEIFGLTQSCVSVYLWFGLHLLNQIVLPMYGTLVEPCWPSEAKQETYASVTRAYDKRLRYGLIGFVDGLNLLIFDPGDPDEQNAYYNGWLSDCYCSQLFVFAPDGRIIFAVLNCPGSWHDAKIARIGGLWSVLRKKMGPGMYIVGDSAFPVNPETDHRIVRTRKACEVDISQNEVDGARDLRTQSAITCVRQAAEWGMRAIKSAFPRLKSCLTSDERQRRVLLRVIVRLFNLRTEREGRNQIRSVYWNKSKTK